MEPAITVIYEQNMILYTPYFRSANKHRNREFDYCLAKNADLFDQIILLCEHPAPQHSHEQIILNRRANFEDVLRHLETSKRKDGIIAIANSDCYFDETLRNSFTHLGENDFWALSRRQHSLALGFRSGQLDCDESARTSQDAWLFRLPILSAFLEVGLYMEFGRYGVDGSIAMQALMAGYKVVNPAHSVNLWHCHDNAAARTEEEMEAGRIYSNYYLPHPVYLGSGPQMVGLVTDKFARPPLGFDPESVAH